MDEKIKVNCAVYHTEAIVTEQNVNILKCINLFEGGAENIYLVDNDGKYRWRAAQRGKSHLKKSLQNKWNIEFFPLPPIVTDLEVEWDSQVAIKKLAYPLFIEHLEATEFPIVDSQGRIKGVVRLLTSSVDTEPATVNWTLLEEASSLLPQKKIYISSLENRWLNNFYEVFSKEISVEVLNEENLNSVLGEKSDGILLCSADVFPSCPKMSIGDLYERLKNEYEPEYRKNINIVVSVSPTILKYVAVPLYIMSKNLPNKKIRLYILHDGLPKEGLARLYEDCAHYKNIEIEDIIVSEEDMQASKELNKYLGRDYWPASVFYGVVAWKYLPKYIDRVMYLDAADLMIIDDIDEFYFSDFDGMEIMATVVEFKKINDNKYVMYDVDDLDDERYRQPIIGERINSGVAMLNLDRMRRTGWDMPVFLEITRKLVAGSSGHDVYLANQSLWCVAYLGRTRAFGAKENELTEFDRAYTPYNVCAYYFKKEKPILNRPLYYDPKVLHFAGAHKPWRIKWNVNPIDEFTDEKVFYRDVKHLPEKRQHIFQYIWHNYAYELVQKRNEWKLITTQIEGIYRKLRESDKFFNYVLGSIPNEFKNDFIKNVKSDKSVSHDIAKSVLGVMIKTKNGGAPKEKMLEFASNINMIGKHKKVFLVTDNKECFKTFQNKFGSNLLYVAKPNDVLNFSDIRDTAMFASQEVINCYLTNLICLSLCEEVIASTDTFDYRIVAEMVMKHNGSSWIVPSNIVAPMSYKVARMSVFLVGEDSRMDIINNNEKHPFEVRKATWIKKSEGDCYLLEYGDGEVNIHLKCHGGHQIGLKFAGYQMYDERRKEHLPIWVKYTSCRINNQEIFNHPLDVCFDKDYWHHFSVKDGEEFDISIKWQMYDYDKEELGKLFYRMIRINNN